MSLETKIYRSEKDSGRQMQVLKIKLEGCRDRLFQCVHDGAVRVNCRSMARLGRITPTVRFAMDTVAAGNKWLLALLCIAFVRTAQPALSIATHHSLRVEYDVTRPHNLTGKQLGPLYG